ncbi:natural resistance-associated macrophage protein [Clavulina sp. PMI_390]|nr:natural resistance-associated macrophage protein [Clavulina sp. PMI_390]
MVPSTANRALKVSRLSSVIRRLSKILRKTARFLGPGAMVSVSYIDPGNYSTGISAGASFRYDLLCVVLISNMLAIFLQTLCLRLGTVTGHDLAHNSRLHLPRWANILSYLFAEAAIIATDLAEVIGVAIALNILSHGKIPLVGGVIITMVDVVIILFFYNRQPGPSSGSRRAGNALSKTQAFEIGVAGLVVAVAVCFAIELSRASANMNAAQVFRGFLPSGTMVKSQGLYNSCGILGATVMPHSLYLGSGIVQSRLKDYDIRHGFWAPFGSELSTTIEHTDTTTTPRPSADYHRTELEIEMENDKYRPSLSAIQNCLPYSLAELIFSLVTFALFINSAIIIVAGSTLYGTPAATDADLFSIYDLLKAQLSSAAATLFAVALLMSGQSAGLVVTLAGQIVSEGYFKWSITPWKRRLITRTIAVIPCIIVASDPHLGRTGLAAVLNASQVALSVVLPVVSAPVIWFTSSRKVMSVPAQDPMLGGDVTNIGDGRISQRGEQSAVVLDDREDPSLVPSMVDMSNSLLVSIVGAVVWLFITALNLYLVISLAMGKS